MQDRYTGDVGDFAKYGLLRYLVGDPPEHIRLGIHWCLTLPEDNNDGDDRSYLADVAEFQQSDPPLYAFLQTIQRGDELQPNELPREVNTIEEGPVFADDTLFFNEILSFDGFPEGYAAAIQQRLTHRQAWLYRAVCKLMDAKIVFFDPDMGFERGEPRHRNEGPKYTYYDELELYVNRGQTLVVYQTGNRERGGVEHHLRNLMRILKQQHGDRIGVPYCCKFRRGRTRSFIILPVGETGDLVRASAVAMMANPLWQPHFTAIDFVEAP